MDWEKYKFHQVIQLPKEYEVYDFTKSYDENRSLKHPFGIGKYNEDRRGMYTEEMFLKDQRTIHMGLDFGAPAGTEVYSMYEGEIFFQGVHEKKGDYGPTLILKHQFENVVLYALYGHLSFQSIQNWKRGDHVSRGEKIASLGEKSENGGWNPHLHFQLSFLEPKNGDLPGVVSSSDREWALKQFPDPRLALGSLY